METNLIEKYVIDQIESLKNDNEELRSKNQELLLKIAKLENKSDEVVEDYQKPALGISYEISTYDWYIKPNNVDKYEKALNEKDFDWLQENNYSINYNMYNYELCVDNLKFKLMLSYYNSKPQACQYSEMPYKTVEEAQYALLEQLRKDIEKFREKEENE